MTTAHKRIYSLLYGADRNLTDDLTVALKRVSDEWQRDKDELDKEGKA